ncbi:MAG TPA: DegT/DnrJ/EryC1/StrS family aminotransferase [Candidatus Saccharimonadales bacterium]|nr:DegT/DnrJ/EryC1/StrS family aminotransferase [Candidatus Saccharimonadales bacterium]
MTISSSAAQVTPVPMLDLKRQYVTIREQVRAAIDQVCESQSLVLGEEVASLEREISEYLGAAATVGCSSGTDALWLALAAIGVGPGDGFLTTPFTFFASASSITRCGACPVFADIDPATFNLSPSAVEHAIEKQRPTNLKGIMPVHLYGQCVDADAFDAVAAAHKLTIVEDAAQAFGATWKGRHAGSLGRSAAFSFYPTKNLSAFGDAGAATTTDMEVGEHMKRLRNHGAARRYYHEEIGWNARMDGIQGAVLRIKLRHIEQWNQRRREIAATYDDLLQKAGLAGARGTSTYVDASRPLALPATATEAKHIFHQYVLRAERRDALREFLLQRQIGCEIYYPVPLHLQQCFAYLGYKPGDFPESERACREVIALPIFPELTGDEQQTVVSAIAEFYSK